MMEENSSCGRLFIWEADSRRASLVASVWKRAAGVTFSDRNNSGFEWFEGDRQGGNVSRTVLKALDVLECLAFSSQSLSAPEVAERCGLTRPTTYRLISTLAARGYVASGQDGRYRLGSKMLSLSKRLIEHAQLPQLARPDLEALCQEAGESVHLGVLEDTEVLYLDKVESVTAARMYSVVGTRNPLHSTSLGKAILAFLPQNERKMLLNRIAYTQRTPNTITDRDSLEQHLEQVRAQGFAVDNVENEEGIRCVGVPVLGNAEIPIAAISISGPTVRMTPERVEELAPMLQETGRRISEKFGFAAHQRDDSPGTLSSLASGEE
jgi:IclR family transcriptional regulator, KDG regulon repressor